MEHINGEMVDNMKDAGKKISYMAGVPILGLTEENMKGIMLTIKSKAKVLIGGQMVKFMMDNGISVNSMVKEL